MKQQGVVLIVAMLILLLIGFLVVTLYETNLMQLRMASNDQDQIKAMHTALSIIDAIYAREKNFPLRGREGHRVCALGVGDSRCDESLLIVEESLIPKRAQVNYFVLRRGPAEISLPVMPQDRVSSASQYHAALFEIQADFVGNGERRASVTVHQGVLVRLVKTGD
jgi:hypothetical protein